MKISLSNLSVGYGSSVVVCNVNLSAAQSQLIALTGRNGTGKSTLIRTMARLQPAMSGYVCIAGKSIDEYSRNELAGLLSIVSTETVNVSYLSVRQLVSLGRFPHTNWIGRLTEKDHQLVDEAIQLTGMTALANKNMHQISDGERQRAMIARTLAQDTDVILLDEPTAFLDIPNKYEVVHLLRRLTRTRRKTIIFSTHDLNIAMQEADKLWMVIDGSVYEGVPGNMNFNRLLERMFEGTKLEFDENKGVFYIKKYDDNP